MRLFYSFLLVSATIFSACTPSSPELKTGIWRGVLHVQGQQLPFNFRVVKDSAGGYDVFMKNATEEILLDEVVFKNDSVDFMLHVFDAELRVAVTQDSLNGFFILNYRDNYRVPFKAAYGQDFRFAPTDSAKETTVNFTGKYQVLFANESDTTQAVGLFTQRGSYATGSFLTPTGDYRYLEGGVFNDTLCLSTFDGNHTYLFKAVLNGDSIRGEYWSGKTFYQPWKGVKSENAAIPNPESLTYLKPGFDRIEFSFPDVDSAIVSLSNEKFRNKVVILQIFGTWCPNCMDETKFLVPWYNQNKDRGVEILGLAYERKPDFAYASDRVKKMKAKWNVPYDFVIAGVNDKAKASETLPALNKIAAFPTTIFIGKDGKVKHIHTGFEGPGTGIYHQQFIERFNQIVNELLSEKELHASSLKPQAKVN